MNSWSFEASVTGTKDVRKQGAQDRKMRGKGQPSLDRSPSGSWSLGRLYKGLKSPSTQLIGFTSFSFCSSSCRLCSCSLPRVVRLAMMSCGDSTGD